MGEVPAPDRVEAFSQRAAWLCDPWQHQGARLSLGCGRSQSRGGMRDRDQRVLCKARAPAPRRGGGQRLCRGPRRSVESATIVLLALAAYASHLVGSSACFLRTAFSMKLQRTLVAIHGCRICPGARVL